MSAALADAKHMRFTCVCGGDGGRSVRAMHSSSRSRARFMCRHIDARYVFPGHCHEKFTPHVPPLVDTYAAAMFLFPNNCAPESMPTRPLRHCSAATPR